MTTPNADKPAKAGAAIFRTIQAPVEAELVEKRSRFIGRLFPVNSEAEALEWLETVRSQERGARHNPYAYRLHDGRTRYSDDGEPAQTAGRPMLDCLIHEELTDVIAVVTRYFGGILLGTGGLVRAYSGALQKAIEVATLAVMVWAVDVQLKVPYGVYEAFNRFLLDHDHLVRVVDVSYGEAVTFRLRVKESDQQTLFDLIADRLHGLPEISVSDPSFLPF